MQHKVDIKAIQENQLDFFFELYTKGVFIGDDKIALLKKHGYIRTEKPSREEMTQKVTESINKDLLSRKNEKNIEADSNIDIVKNDGESTDKNSDTFFDIITDTELEKRRAEYGHIFEGRDKPIVKADWVPKSATVHERDFIDWINSINRRGFKNKIHYRKFNLYCQQAYSWLQDNLTSSDFEDEDEKEEYRQKEIERCAENSLYFLNKYVWYKEGNAKDKTGRIKYIAMHTHEFMAYMNDCGYSIIIAKGRQQAVTTTIMALNVCDVIFKPNHHMIFVCEDDKKAVSIFDAKLKFAFSNLPDWLRPVPLNERDNLFKIGYKSEKGVKEGVGSSIEVLVPKRTAIAGNAPQKILIDEAGNIPILGEMIGNARPTMYWYNPDTKKQEIARQIWIYGTGGEMEKGGKAFETEFTAIAKDWDEGTFDSCIVPVFFDWRCRMGADENQREAEKRMAYRKAENPADPKGKGHITEFYQSWPESLSDVFRTGAKTLIDEDYIEKALKRINEEKQKHGFTLHQSGFFEPVYDQDFSNSYQDVLPENVLDAHRKIIGSNFVPTEDIDPRASTVIFMQPKTGWLDRYYKGTDPIDTDTGLSDFSSSVWDNEFNTLAAILAWRIPDYPKVFEQSLLLNIYYADGNPAGIPELIESNRGSAYFQYMKERGYEEAAVINEELPEYLRNKSAKNEGVGIDSHGDRTMQIINIMFAMFKAYGMNFYHDSIFEQAKTFTCNISKTGREVWGPMNKKYFKDDRLWSATYSYICAKMCFGHTFPKNIEKLKTETRIVSKLVRNKDLTLTRLVAREKVYNARA